uniref:Uncharacterized protein n=1 Tax=Cuerna arida TaxID=1464854 RepID=A0A1B6H143_9HEMI
MFKKLICFSLVVTMVRSDTTDVSSSFEGPTEDLKEYKADSKDNAVALRSNGGLFGLGIGGNLLGINAGAGISHGRGGWGEVGMSAYHPGYVPYETPNNRYY